MLFFFWHQSQGRTLVRISLYCVPITIKHYLGTKCTHDLRRSRSAIIRIKFEHGPPDQHIHSGVMMSRVACWDRQISFWAFKTV